ncbi:MAG TPA: pilus assembly protein TadG-related protein [Vulgatibacter sp.]|nr:pilus assembly protein TadG-related protein [Vulgatibacter sp.]
MLARIRSLSREEDGQALVLAALLLFAVALVVLGTANLGNAIRARIELQNAADAAAYDLAAHEARAFNHYAYTNRAQISQYVTILQLLSVDAMVLGVLGSLGALSAVLKTLGEVCAGAKAAACALVPIVGELLVLVSRIASVLERVCRTAAELFLAFDRFVGTVAVPLLVGANAFLYATQASFRAAVTARLAGDEALRLARSTSPGAEEWGGPLVRAANVARYRGSHLEEAGRLGGTKGSPHKGLADGPEGRMAYARRAMAELVHATRYGEDVYDRSFPGPTRLGRVMGAELLDLFGSVLPGAAFRGHTRFHSDENPRPDRRSMRAYYAQLEGSGQYVARYPIGSSIGANFYLMASSPSGIAELLGMNAPEMSSVTSTGVAHGGGWACTWDVRDPYERRGVPDLAEIFVPRYSCEVNRGMHPWWGILPYMAFDSTREGCASVAEENCQPDVWVALRLPASEANLPTGAAGASIDLEVGTPGGAAHASHAVVEGDGPRVVSRALAYYHRPGNWQEHPNFFNPYWRAKLAPVEPGLERAGAAALRALLPAGITGRALTH